MTYIDFRLVTTKGLAHPNKLAGSQKFHTKQYSNKTQTNTTTSVLYKGCEHRKLLAKFRTFSHTSYVMKPRKNVKNSLIKDAKKRDKY